MFVSTKRKHRRRNIFFSGDAILPKSGVSGYTDELGMHSAW